MIQFIKGNILDSKAQALVNTVNTVGVMGKGIALQFKKAFPENYHLYKKACKAGEIEIGKLFVTRDSNLHAGEKIIINFPTKKHWRNPSQYRYIQAGLNDLVRVIHEHDITSIAIPPLGSGNGGLQWNKVKKLIFNALISEEIDVFVHEPIREIPETRNDKPAKLTPARALLLYMLFEQVRNGEYPSEFSSEKICYFLQRNGAQNVFKLKFESYHYGPYSGKVRFILNELNGSYIKGVEDMSNKPFDPIFLIPERYEEVEKFVNTNSKLKKIVEKASSFLDGFYSDFSLELLSSVDYLIQKEESYDKNLIMTRLDEWNERKRTKFSNPKYIDISIEHIQNAAT